MGTQLKGLVALEMSEESAQTIATEDESYLDCAWEFDASPFVCLKDNIVDNIGLEHYRPTCFSYSFKFKTAEPLLLSLLCHKMLRLPEVRYFVGI